jgi:hypothetical protein
MREWMKVLCTAMMCFVVSATGWSQQASLSPAKSDTPANKAATSTAAPASTTAQTAATPAKSSDAVVAAPKKEPAPEHPCTEAQVREYLAESGGDKAAHVIMANMARSSRASSPPYIPEGFWNDMMDSFGKVDLVTVFLPIYQQHVSEEDMAAVLGFYKTPAGKHFLDAQPQMAGDVQQALAKTGHDLGHDVYMKYKEKIEAAKLQFDAQQQAGQSQGPSTKAPSNPAPATNSTPAPK